MYENQEIVSQQKDHDMEQSRVVSTTDIANNLRNIEV